MASQRYFAVIFAFMEVFMGERYKRYSTANDVMKEFLIYGAELTEIIKRGQLSPSKHYFFF